MTLSDAVHAHSMSMKQLLEVSTEERWNLGQLIFVSGIQK